MTTAAAETQAYIAKLIRNYGDDRAAMQRLLARFECCNDESWTLAECAEIAASLRSAISSTPSNPPA